MEREDGENVIVKGDRGKEGGRSLMINLGSPCDTEKSILPSLETCTAEMGLSQQEKNSSYRYVKATQQSAQTVPYSLCIFCTCSSLRPCKPPLLTGLGTLGSPEEGGG